VKSVSLTLLLVVGVGTTIGGLIPEPPRAEVDQHLAHGDRVSAGAVTTEVLHTPGHTPGSLSFHVQGGEPLLLSGDTLFAGSIGRTDLWGGDFDQEIASIRSRLLTLDETTRVIPGHGPVATKADLQKYKDNLQTLHTRTRELIKQGVPKDQYVSRLKTDDLGWGVDPASLFVRAAAGGFYDELQAGVK